MLKSLCAFLWHFFGHLAQLVESSLDVRVVMGSSPLVSTIISMKVPVKWALFIIRGKFVEKLFLELPISGGFQ